MLIFQAAAVPSGAPSPDSDIVVVARQVAGAKRALEACIARQCLPNEEIRAALVYSTRQFLAGDYTAARQTLMKTRHRTAKFDAQYPVAVSDLHRALNSLANLDGHPDAARLSAFDATDALRAGLAPDHPLILLQRLDTARQFAREGHLESCTQILNNVVSKAHKQGYYSVEAQALFQGAALFAALATADPAYRNAAKLWRNRIADRTENEFGEYRDALKLLDAQIATLAVRRRDRDRVLANSKPIATTEAMLLREPEVRDFGLVGTDANTKPEWADVAFWVRADGSVADVMVLGRSKSLPGAWLARKLTAVAGRRYAPLKNPVDRRGMYRVERYSMVYPLLPITESRIPVRSGRGHLETTDITLAYRQPPAS
ncbi:hypothetical protein FHT00_000563 [Sphingomonas insulae]|uniref:hypothetical protein n=1 Tax=Sphingomonas insulae TaxID=424800 RepID=UPI0031D73D14|nr:hypothetical protein [Sphingomonas insulae]